MPAAVFRRFEYHLRMGINIHELAVVFSFRLPFDGAPENASELRCRIIDVIEDFLFLSHG